MTYFRATKPQAFVAFQVRVTPELKQQLTNYALQLGRSQVSIVTEALEDYFRNHPFDESDEESPSS